MSVPTKSKAGSYWVGDYTKRAFIKQYKHNGMIGCGHMEFDLDVYGVESDLNDALKKLDFIQRNWYEVFPNDVNDIDLSRHGEAHFMIEDRKKRIANLNDKLDHLHAISSRMYEISQYVEKLIAECKASTLIARGHISFIANFDQDIKDANALWDAELKRREEKEEKWFVEDKGKGKRKSHRR